LLDYAIVFALGFLIAGLLAFAMLPIVWRRALRLTRRQLETGIPISMAEVRAGQDQIRAEAAILQRRLEMRAEAERDRRHEVMAENGRQSRTIRRLGADIAQKEARLRDLEAGGQTSLAVMAGTEQELAQLKADLAAARIALTTTEQTAETVRRELNQSRMDNDGLRVEIVAMRTKLGTAEDEMALRRREIDEVTAAGVERDNRIALQATEIATRSSVIASLESQLTALERQLRDREAERPASADPYAAERSKELARREAALSQREARIAAAETRERELVAEIARLKGDSQRAAQELANGFDSLRGDRQAVLSQLETARAERTRLQTEVMALKREARESWLVIEDDNRQLRIAMARIAAEIARQAAERRSSSYASVEEIVAEPVPEPRDMPRLPRTEAADREADDGRIAASRA
jgi:chromosome segregation ATPase